MPSRSSEPFRGCPLLSRSSKPLQRRPPLARSSKPLQRRPPLSRSNKPLQRRPPLARSTRALLKVLAAALLCPGFAQAAADSTPETVDASQDTTASSEGAGASNVAIAWGAPPVCPSQRELERQIELLLRRPLTSPRAHAIVVRGKVIATAEGDYEVIIRATSEFGPSERLVRHRDCGSLTEAAALVIALAIDPEALSQDEAICPVIPPGTELLPVPPPEPYPGLPALALAPPCDNPKPCHCRAQRPPATVGLAAKKSARPAPRIASFDIAAFGGATAGLLPQAAPFLGLSLGASYAEEFQIRIEGRYWKRQEFAVGGYTDAQAQLRPLALELRGCWAPYRPSWALAFCSGPELGALASEARGEAFDRRTQAHGWWWGWAAAVGIEVPVARQWFLQAGLEGGVVVSRPEVGFYDAGKWVPVASPGRFVGSMILGAGARLP